MAKDRKKLQHIHSSVPDKQPTPSTLEVGEIAVNNSKDQEFLSIKNSEDKVVRFSSDEQIVTIMEKKEVMPYVGYVRGETGPSATSADTPTADARGSYGITNNDLLNNKSNIVVKLNQVAAGNTVKHDRVNGAKDAYNKLVNPTTDSGVTDGAGFFIDMSRYAMQDANPSFSSTTNTCRTTMSGTTIIRGLDGACGSLLDIKVNSAKTDIETANTEITSAVTTIGNATTTVSGNTTLNVSGTTTENLNGKWTVSASSGTEISSCSGFTINTNDYKVKQCAGTSGSAEFDFCGGYKINTDNMVISACTTGGTMTVKENAVNVSGGTLTIRESGATDFSGATLTETVTGNSTTTVGGNTTITTSGNTVIHSDGAVGITAKEDITAVSSEKDVIITANKNLCATAGDNATIYGEDVTNLGTKCDGTGASTTTNMSGVTINVSGTTFNENIGGNSTVNIGGNETVNVGGATTINSTGNTCINSSAVAAMVGSTKTNVGKNCSDGGQTTTLNLNGTTINETGTTVNISGSSNVNVSADTICLSGKTAASMYAPTTNVGTSCGGSSATTINISGTTINEGGTTLNQKITNVSADTTNYTINTTNYDLNGAEICISGSTKANVYGATTNVGVDCNGSTTATTINVSGTTINEGGTTLNETFTNENINVTNYDLNGDKICISGATNANIYGKTTNVGVDCDGSTTATTINISGNTINEGGTNITIEASSSYTISTGDLCLTSTGDADFGGDTNTRVGTNCQGTGISNNTTIYASSSVTINSPITNITGDTNISGNTIISGNTNISGDTIIGGDTNISGDTIIGGSLTIISGLSKTLSWTYGDVKSASSGSTNFKDDKSFVIPKCASDINRAQLKIVYGDSYDKSGEVVYDPADNCTNSVSKTVNIPTCVSNLHRAKFGYSYGSVSAKSSSDNGTYDPGEACNESTTDSIVIPTCIADLKNWNGSCYSFDEDICVTGDVTATGSFYSTSDERKKENIEYIDNDSKLKVRNIPLKSFNYKEDATKRKLYGVIAQEVEAAGLNELVHTDEQGIKAVDYTSFLILRIAYLEKLVGRMNDAIAKLEEKLDK